MQHIPSYPQLDAEAQVGFNNEYLAFSSRVNASLMTIGLLTQLRHEADTLEENYLWLIGISSQLLEDFPEQTSERNRLPFEFKKRLDLLGKHIQRLKIMRHCGEPTENYPEVAVFTGYLAVNFAMAAEMKNYFGADF